MHNTMEMFLLHEVCVWVYPSSPPRTAVESCSAFWWEQAWTGCQPHVLVWRWKTHPQAWFCTVTGGDDVVQGNIHTHMQPGWSGGATLWRVGCIKDQLVVKLERTACGPPVKVRKEWLTNVWSLQPPLESCINQVLRKTVTPVFWNVINAASTIQTFPPWHIICMWPSCHHLKAEFSQYLYSWWDLQWADVRNQLLQICFVYQENTLPTQGKFVVHQFFWIPLFHTVSVPFLK